jgi:hypothetical protein
MLVLHAGPIVMGKLAGTIGNWDSVFYVAMQEQLLYGIGSPSNLNFL